MGRAVVVTGCGVVCAAGTSAAAFTDSLLAGASCVSEIDDSRIAHFRARQAGMVRDFDEAACMEFWHLSPPCDRHVLLGLDALAQALDAGGLGRTLRGIRAAGVFSTCSGGMLSVERHYGDDPSWLAWDQDTRWYASRYFTLARLGAHLVHIDGPVITVTTACSASTNALGVARDLIALGRADLAVVCGADSFSLTTLAGFDALKATCRAACSPFSVPAGMNLGEAGVCLVVESAQSAQGRGAGILGTVLGYGSSNDAYHSTAPEPGGRGAAAAMTRALRDAGCAAEQIGYINAHGTGTEANDKTETRAMRHVFGEGLDRIPVSSIKGGSGHCLGAAGLLEVAGSLLCARKGFYPPSINFSRERDGCRLHQVGNASRPWVTSPLFMSNNLAFGGNNASLVLRAGASAATGVDGVSALPGHEVCIGALGCATVYGIGARAFFDGVGGELQQGRGERIDVEHHDPARVDRRMDLRGADGATRVGSMAASLALQECGIGARDPMRRETGLCIHCSHTQPWAEAAHIRSLFQGDFRLDNLSAFPSVVPNAVNGAICRALGLGGHNLTTCFGPGAGLAGIGVSADAVALGHAPLVLCGACDANADGNELPGAEGCPRSVSPGAIMLALGRRDVFAACGVSPLATVKGWDLCADTGCAAGTDTQGERLQECLARTLQGCGGKPPGPFSVCGSSSFSRDLCSCGGFAAGAEGEVLDFGAVFNGADSLDGMNELAWVLLRSRFEPAGSNKYILSLSRLPGGFTTALFLAIEPHQE